MISNEVREEIRRRYHYRCGYCGVSEAAIGSLLELDHFRPKSAEGGDDLENLVYCCTACNRRKGRFWPRVDTTTQRLLHPKRDDLTQHFIEEESGMLTALTETGAFHIERLELNRPRLISLRKSWQSEHRKEAILKAEEFKQNTLRTEILAAAQKIQLLFDEINQILNR